MLARTNMYYCPFVIFCSFYLALLLNCDSGSHFRINVTKSSPHNLKQVNETQRKSLNKTSMRLMQVAQLVPQMTKRTHVLVTLNLCTFFFIFKTSNLQIPIYSYHNSMLWGENGLDGWLQFHTICNFKPLTL